MTVTRIAYIASSNIASFSQADVSNAVHMQFTLSRAASYLQNLPEAIHSESGGEVSQQINLQTMSHAVYILANAQRL